MCNGFKLYSCFTGLAAKLVVPTRAKAKRVDEEAVESRKTTDKLDDDWLDSTEDARPPINIGALSAAPKSQPHDRTILIYKYNKKPET
jgi:hypothetical protein